jgi:hypothetical protein
MQLTDEELQRLDGGGSVSMTIAGRTCVLLLSDVFAAQQKSRRAAFAGTTAGSNDGHS